MDGAFLSEARMWANGTGADVMKRLAAPQVGGVFSAMLLTLLVMWAIYTIWRWHAEVKRLPPPPHCGQRRPPLQCLSGRWFASGSKAIAYRITR